MVPSDLRNACQAWRYAVTAELGSKLAGGAWARERWPRPDVVDAALVHVLAVPESG